MDLNPDQRQNVIAALLPRPHDAELGHEDLVLSERSRILVSPKSSKSSLFAATRLADLIAEELGLQLDLIEHEAVLENHMVVTQAPEKSSGVPVPERPLSDEEYVLNVDQSAAVVQASTPKGLLWGAMTLRQVIVREGNSVLACAVRIHDSPRYPWRGYQVDSGRAPNSLPTLKRIVRICSAFKLNAVMFREGDDELNAVKYRTNKLGSLNPCALTMEQVEEFVEYADQHGITVIPEIESLGHSRAKSRHYSHLVEGGIETHYEGIGTHIRKAHLKPGNAESLELLRSIYEEWLPSLESALIHLGLDEVKLSAEEQAKHFERLLPLLDELGRKHDRVLRPIVWADAPGTPSAYRDRVVRCLWRYGHPDSPELRTENLQRQGFDELSADGCPESVFMAGGSGSLHTPYTKGSYRDAFKNLADWARWGKDRPNFTGLFAVQWHGNMLDDWLPDFLAAADFGWSPPEPARDFAGEFERVQRHLTRIKDAKEPDPKEMDPPAWDGIWLEDRKWKKNIMA